jgi:6-phosphogluconolactonase
MAHPKIARPYTIYLGTYNGPQSQGVYRCTLDDQTGQLSAPLLVAEAENASFLDLSPNGRTLYAVCEAQESVISAWSISKDEKLTALGQQPTGGAGACHVSVDATGQTVLVANYGGGSVAAFSTREDGSLGPCSTLIQHYGSGPNQRRQEKPHAHFIAVNKTEDDRNEASQFAYSCDLGTDQVFVYRLDGENGRLEPADPPFANVPAGAGPRHLAFHRLGFVFVNNEMGLSVTAFKREKSSGALTAIQTISTLPKDIATDSPATEGVSTAEIAVHPSGSWLYVSNRGRDTITTFRVAADGHLTWMHETATPAEPRGFDVSPDGHWLVVGGQKSNQVAAFRVDSEVGALTPSGMPVKVGAPVCVVFAASQTEC